MRMVKCMMRLATTVAAVLFLLMAGRVLAADSPTTTNPPPVIHLTLAQAMAEALSLSPGLKAAGHQVSAARHDASAAARARWGELDSVGSYSYLN
ncbi:MAG: hypothetical protein M1608_09530, partial [Candidatus Omnitrophica bacterium]|nr:hypothetical protein [Candidatus Omnitrophota bacterium]